MIGSYARRLRDVDYPWGPTREERDAFCARMRRRLGRPGRHRGARARRWSRDPAFRDWWASYLRMGASPGAAVALTRMNAEIDVRDVLPSIRVPTLVLHRRGDRCLKVEEGRYLASRIPGAAFVELAGRRPPAVCRRPGRDPRPDRALPVARPRRGPDAAGAVLATRAHRPLPTRRRPIAEHLRRVFEREVGVVPRPRHRLGDDPAGRDVRRSRPRRACGCAVAAVARPVAASRSAPASTSANATRRRPTARSSAISAALADAAGPGEVLVSRTVVDLVPGSGLQFADRGRSKVAGQPRGLSMLSLSTSSIAP